jgi:hypothetical protein
MKLMWLILAFYKLFSSTPWEIAAGLEPSIQDDDEDELDLDVDDPAIEELGLALAPKSKREKKKVFAEIRFRFNRWLDT